MSARPRLLVGLGNPKPAYDRTRHNIGREYINHLAIQTNNSFEKSRQAELISLSAFFNVPLDPPLVCAKLLSFMNVSGGPVKQLMITKELKSTEVLVVLDDFSLPFGTLRMRKSGSAGGHNGLQSLIDVLGTEDIPRLRVGIGPASPAGGSTPPPPDPTDYVLEKFTKQELSKIPEIFDAVTDGLKVLLAHGYEKAMTVMNKSVL